MEKQYINGLDGLRAIAIMMVFFYHLQLPFAKGGLLGVPVFFVLSGYLITRNMTKEIAETGTFHFLTFWKKRIVRLFPLVLTVTAFAILMTAILDRVAFTKGCKDLLSAIFFYNNWWQIINQVSYFESAGTPSPLTHFWALAVEIQFYLVFPLVVFVLSKFPKKEKVTLYVVIAFAFVSAVLMGVMFHPGDDPSRVYYGTDTRLYSFLFGAILDLLTGAYRSSHRYPEALSDFVGIPAMLLLIVCMCVWDGHSNWLYWGGYVLVSLFAVLVIYTVLDNNSILARMLGCKPLQWLGNRSYSIYLWHYVVIIILTGGIKAKWWMNLLVILLSFLLASLGYHFIETPVRKGVIGEYFALLGDRSGTAVGRRIKARKVKRMQIVSGICVAVLFAEVLCVAFVPKRDLANIAAEKTEIQYEAAQIAKERLEKQQLEKQQKEEREVAEAETEAPQTDKKQPEKQQAEEPESTATEEEATQTDKKQPEKQQEEEPESTATEEEAPQTDKEDSKKQQEENHELTKAEKEELLQNLSVLLIGDSITLDVTKYYYETFPNGIADCKIGRCAFSGDEVYNSNVNDGWNGDAVIYELGSNDLLTDELDEMRELLDPDIKMFVCSIVTPHEDYWDANNKMIREFVERTENTYLIDWYEYSKDHPEYFDQDDTHLLPVGGKAYNELIKETVLEAYKDTQKG